MKKYSPTMRVKVWLSVGPSVYRTATDLSYDLGVKLSSLSSLLKKMCDEGILQREKGCGPRGGYGYRLSLGRGR